MPSIRNPNRHLVLLLQLLLALAFLAAWEWKGRHDLTFRYFMSQPTKILARTWTWLMTPETYLHTWHTVAETAAGFAAGAVIGLVLAICCFYQPLLYRVLQPFLDVLNAMPRVVFSPLFILWFGLGFTSKAVLAASLVLFIVFMATLTGLREVDPNLVYKLRLMGASDWGVLLHCLLPSGLTWVFTSLRTSVGFALAGAVVGEYVGASRGLGYQIALAEGNLDATGIFTGLLILSVVVLLMNEILARVERRLTPWRLQSGTTA
jgi:NitT/TauT family transport system permease protein